MADTFTPSEARRLFDARRAAVATAIKALALTACLWGGLTLPVVLRNAPIDAVGATVIAGDPFKVEFLTGLLPQLDAIDGEEGVRPSTLRNAMAIRLRLLELALTGGDRRAIDEREQHLQVSLDRLLAAAPADGFAWLVRFWLANTREGFTPANLRFLDMSYALAPNEGWIAAHRDPLAVALFRHLPPALAHKVVREFAEMVDSAFYRDAAEVLVGPGWTVRDTLLSSLDTATLYNRQLFARYVEKLGYIVPVIGIERPEPRPWQ
jgi:hypothetical protein